MQTELRLEPNELHKKQYEYNGRVFFDMDGVLADYGASAETMGIGPDVTQFLPGFFEHLPPITAGVQMLLDLEAAGVDVWIATKIPVENSFAATEKLRWVERFIPSMISKVIITHHKGMLAVREDDVLVDDRPHKASIEEFTGFVVPLTWAEAPTWKEGRKLLETYLGETTEGRQRLRDSQEWRGEVRERAQQEKKQVNPFTYKGFVGRLSFSQEDNQFYGEVPSPLATLEFEGETMEVAQKAFRETVDELIDIKARKELHDSFRKSIR